jgi:hypothetical protein
LGKIAGWHSGEERQREKGRKHSSLGNNVENRLPNVNSRLTDVDSRLLNVNSRLKENTTMGQ